MKALFIASDLNRLGGIQNYNKGLLKAFREYKTKILVAEIRNSNVFSKTLLLLNIFFKYIFLRPDFVFCSHINFSPIGFFYKKLFGKDFIVFTHGIEAWSIKNNLRIKSLKAARFVITVSNFTKDKLVQENPELKEKIFLLPDFVDENEFVIKEDKKENLLRKYNLPEGSQIVLTVSRLAASEKYKGYDEIIRVLPKIIKEVPEVKYVLVGEGDDAERVRQLTKEYHLNDRVVLTGRVSDSELLDYFNLCDVFAMPSKGEGFGIVFLNALACGKPVVAGNKDASREPLLNGELGILVDPENKDEIAAAIINILKKKTDKKFFDSQFLRKRVLEVYGFDKFKERVRILLNELQRQNLL